MNLNQSSLWKESSLFQDQNLRQIQFQGREYFGFFLKSPLTFKELTEWEKELTNQLQHFCPKLRTDKLKAVLFPQIFLS